MDKSYYDYLSLFICIYVGIYYKSTYVLNMQKV